MDVVTDSTETPPPGVLGGGVLPLVRLGLYQRHPEQKYAPHSYTYLDLGHSSDSHLSPSPN